MCYDKVSSDITCVISLSHLCMVHHLNSFRVLNESREKLGSYIKRKKRKEKEVMTEIALKSDFKKYQWKTPEA